MRFPSPKELKAELPLAPQERDFIEYSRKIVQKIISGEDKRLALIIGPCSIHQVDAALNYAEQLAKLTHRVHESCFLVMRVYVEKSRTATGWKGMLYDPYLDGSHALETGLRESRKLFLELAKRKIPTAMEFVDPLASFYLDDLVTWGFIGARTAYSQPHRQLASSLSCPVGFKNGLDGDIGQSLHSLIAAASPHTFLSCDEEGRLSSTTSRGNPWVHLVLRGSLTQTNYDALSVNNACSKLSSRNLRPRLLIDCAHGNCQKVHEKQKEVFGAVIEQVQNGNEQIMGLMLESHLYAGNQSLSDDELSLKYGVSITDPCLDWASTEELILSADELLSAPNNLFSILPTKSASSSKAGSKA